MLLSTTTEGRTDGESPGEELRLYELHRRIECFFRALKTGTFIRSRQLDGVNVLGVSVDIDTITAFRVWNLSLLAREKPVDKPVTQGEIDVLLALALTVSTFSKLTSNQARTNLILVGPHLDLESETG